MTTTNQINKTLSGNTGTGSFVGTTSPTLVTPSLDAATATSINFGGSALNYYAELLSWTPAITFATPGNLSVSYATQVGLYSRTGNIVWVTCSLTFTPTFTTASGAFSIAGLPFTSNLSNGNINHGSCFTSGVTFTAGNISLECEVVNNGTSIIPLQSPASGNSAGFTTANFTSGVQVSIGATLAYLL